MPHRITRDQQMFRGIIAGQRNRELKKYINNGRFLSLRDRNGKIVIPLPGIELPHIQFGRPGEGLGRGEGSKGDVVGRDKGKSKGNEAGDSPGDPIGVEIDMQEILDEMQKELQLPNPRRKENETYEDTRIKYTNLSRVGPNALLHKKRTMLQCMKRMAASGTLNQPVWIPGLREPMTVLSPETDDKRYRQYREIKIPSSNAVIFFARDISGSMTDDKIEILSDMAWWLDCWIRRNYDKTECCYIVHDTDAREVSEKRFYRLKYGGGTICSSAMKFIAKQLKHRYPPSKWNIYVFYFSDGDNWGGDNKVFCDTIEESLIGRGSHPIASLVGITQILGGTHEWALKSAVDSKIIDGTFDNNYIRTTAINGPQGQQLGWGQHLPDDFRYEATRNALRDLLRFDRKQVFPVKEKAA